MEIFRGGEQMPDSENAPESEIEKIDAEIKQMLETLRGFDFESFSPEIQQEWYDVEMEAEVGLHRAEAKDKLELFINKLRSESNKQQ